MGTSIVNDPISETAPRTGLSGVCRCGTKKIPDRTSIDTIRIFRVNAAGKSLIYYRAGVGGKYELLKNCSFPFFDFEMISREACNLWSLNFRIFSKIFVKKKYVASNVSFLQDPSSLLVSSRSHRSVLSRSFVEMFDALFFSNLLVRESTNRVAVCDDTKVEEEREREREREENMKRLPYLGWSVGG